MEKSPHRQGSWSHHCRIRAKQITTFLTAVKVRNYFEKGQGICTGRMSVEVLEMDQAMSTAEGDSA